MALRHYVDLIWYYRRLVVWIVLSVTAVTFVVSVYNIVVDPRYKAAAVVTYLPTDTAVDYSREISGGTRESRTNYLTQTIIEHLLSRPVLETTLAELNKKYPPDADMEGPSAFASLKGRIKSLIWYGRYIPPDDHENAIKAFRESISLEAQAGSFVLRIEVTMDDPQMASDAANGLATAFVARARQESQIRTSEVIAYYKSEIARTQQALNQVLQKEADIAKQGGALTTGIALEQEKYLQVRGERENVEARLAYLKSVDGRAANGDLPLMEQQLAELRRREAMYKSAMASINELLSSYQAQGQSLRELALERQYLTREISEFRGSLNQVRGRMSGGFSPVQIIESAIPAIYPVPPSIPKSTFSGFVASLLIALFAVVAIDLFSSKIRTRADLESVVGESIVWPLHLQLIRGKESLSGLLRSMRASGRNDEEDDDSDIDLSRHADGRQWRLRQFAEKTQRGLAVLGHLDRRRLAIAGLCDERLVSSVGQVLLIGFDALGFETKWVASGRDRRAARGTADAAADAEEERARSQQARDAMSGPAAPDPSDRGPIEFLDLGSIGGRFRWDDVSALNPAMICVVQAGEVDKDTVQQILASADQRGISSLSFVLITR